MTLPFALPSWLPWWVPTLILVPLLLYALVFVLMPFSVMGVKGRLEALDARLDDIQGEIRMLALRLPEQLRGGYAEPPYAEPPYVSPPYVSPPGATERGVRAEPLVSRPPIPPAPQEPDGEAGPDLRRARRDLRSGRSQTGPSRAEPRLDWPRS